MSAKVQTGFMPGPWRADWDDNGHWFIEPLGITGHGLRGDSGECIESATAHLIAASPTMYTALEIARNFIAEELACREQSMLPEGSKEDGAYIRSAREALRLVNDAIKQADGKDSQ